MAFEIDSVARFRYVSLTHQIEYDGWRNELVFRVDNYTTFLPGRNRVYSGIFPFPEAFEMLDIPSAVFESGELELLGFKLYDVFADRHGELIFEIVNELDDKYITQDEMKVYIRLK